MVFSEPIFLFVFLTACLAVYFLTPARLKNLVLIAFSLVFYAWGEEVHVLILIYSIGMNYSLGLGIGRAEGAARRVWLWAGLLGNLGLLGYFKYTGFLLATLGVQSAADLAPALPIGISFFTFQALSYLIDLYCRRIEAQRDPLKLALYISLFPQLIAGPIVRYSEIESRLEHRRTDRSDLSKGVHRFVTGLAKKTLIADPMGLLADQIFAMPSGSLSPETAWLGAIAYTLQLYFDFSAYSDMAIGLGRIFGFRFPENFNYPYRAQSVTEFWRRWHMTLSRWFRDYLYIPLGGNRAGATRTYLNLWIVFLATGIWHGAGWTFIFWGAYHGVFLIIERLGLGSFLARTPAVLRHVYLLLAVILGWVAFRAADFGQMIEFYGAMLLLESGSAAPFYPIARYADGYFAAVMAVGILLSAGFAPWLGGWLAARSAVRKTSVLGREIWFWALFVITVVSIGAASYSPFIYFRF